MARRVFDQVLLRAVESNAEDAGVDNLVDALVELEQDGVQIERGGDLLADLAEQFDRVFLRRNFRGLRADLLRALVDRGFQSLGLGFERFGLAAGLSRARDC